MNSRQDKSDENETVALLQKQTAPQFNVRFRFEPRDGIQEIDGKITALLLDKSYRRSASSCRFPQCYRVLKATCANSSFLNSNPHPKHKDLLVTGKKGAVPAFVIVAGFHHQPLFQLGRHKGDHFSTKSNASDDNNAAYHAVLDLAHVAKDDHLKRSAVRSPFNTDMLKSRGFHTISPQFFDFWPLPMNRDVVSSQEINEDNIHYVPFQIMFLPRTSDQLILTDVFHVFRTSRHVELPDEIRNYFMARVPRLQLQPQLLQKPANCFQDRKDSTKCDGVPLMQIKDEQWQKQPNSDEDYSIIKRRKTQSRPMKIHLQNPFPEIPVNSSNVCREAANEFKNAKSVSFRDQDKNSCEPYSIPDIEFDKTLIQDAHQLFEFAQLMQRQSQISVPATDGVPK